MNSKSHLFLSSAILGSALCSSVSYGVINGIERKYPQVAVIASLKDHHTNIICSATLIAPSVLLTAAHCGEQDAHMVVQIAGEGYFGTLVTPQNYSAVKAMSLGSSSLFDIAVVHLDRKVVGVEPWPIRSREIDVNPQEWFYFMGFGDSTGLGFISELTSRLGTAKISTVSNYSFTADFRANTSAALHGDSGGPAFVYENNKFKIIGVFSQFTGKFLPDFSRFTKISSDAHWDFLKTEINRITVEEPQSQEKTCFENATHLGWSLFYVQNACKDRMDLPDNGRTQCILEKVSNKIDWNDAADVCSRGDRPLPTNI